MPKKTRAGDRHKSGRKSIMVPERWHALLEKMACDDGRPMMWYLVGLIRDRAKDKGHKAIPPMPWEESL